MRINLGLYFLVLTMFLSGGMSAQAGTVAATFDGVSPGAGFQYRLNNAIWATEAGSYRFTRSGGDYDADVLNGSFATFCIEINQPVRIGRSYEYEVVSLETAPFPGIGAGDGAGMGFVKANDIRLLWAVYHDQVALGPLHAAAFQIAIWEIIYDGDMSLNAGDFRARYPNLTAAILAQSWLSSLPNIKPVGSLPNLMALTSPLGQDQVFMASWDRSNSESAPLLVPLPAAAWAGAGLLGAIVAMRIRRSRNAA